MAEKKRGNRHCCYGQCNSDECYPDRCEGVTFIPFPKPKTRLEVCKAWIKACGRPHDQLNPSLITKNYFVCSKMVRTYKKKTTRGHVCTSVRQDAVDAVLQGLSLRKAAVSFNIPRETLRRAVAKVREGKELKSFTDSCKTRQVFSKAEEMELTEYILKASRIGFPLDSKTIRTLSFQLAERNKISFPHSWAVNGMAGEDWLSGFLKRHECISRRTPEATSLARATAFNRTNVEAFFSRLQDLYSRYQIYNLDETGLTTSQKPHKVVAEAGTKQVAQIVSHERGETVTMCGFINAVGNALPPVLIFPRKKFKLHMLHNAPPGAKGLANQSGWMTGDLFQDCLQHFVRHTCVSKENPTLLLLDNHNSHVTLAAVDFCRDKGVHLLSFPPHCSHKLQPLDKTVFGPLKKFYYSACNDWMYHNPGERMTIYDVAGLIGKAYPKAFTMTNIVSGFKSTGISPLDVSIFSEDDFVQSYVTDQPAPRLQDVPSSETCATPVQSESLASAHMDETFLTLQQDSNNVNRSRQNRTVQEEQMKIAADKTTFSACSLVILRPHPKAPRREIGKKRKGRLGKTRILTDTPEKDEIAAKEATKRKTVPARQAGQESTTKRLFDQQAKGAEVSNVSGRTVLKASYHQGDSLFSPETRGRQCTAIAAAAVACTTQKGIREWSKADLDLILLAGDLFYTKIDRERPDTEDGYLLISDIPDQAELFNIMFSFDKIGPVHGLVSQHQSSELAFTLADGIGKVFQQRCSAILIIRDMSVMIHACKEDSTCFLFDSHARDRKGMPIANGKSVLITFKHSSDLVQYLYEFARTLEASNVIPYEIVGMEAVPVLQGVFFDEATEAIHIGNQMDESSNLRRDALMDSEPIGLPICAAANVQMGNEPTYAADLTCKDISLHFLP